MSERKHPLFVFGIPEHIRVAGFAVESDNGVSGIDFEGLSIVRAVGEALCLAHAGRSV